jgi:hypothetical protein
VRRSLGWLIPLLTSLHVRAQGVAEPVPAQEKAALQWVRSERAGACPSEADVALAIEQRLGRGALVPKQEASLIVEAELDAAPSGGFRAVIVMRRGTEVVGRRELESADAGCQSVAETAALVIALTIDPQASFEPLPVGAAPAPGPPAPVELSSPPPTSAAALPQPAPTPALWVQPEAPRWQAELELAVGIATGVVPNVAGGVHASGRAAPPSWPLSIQLQAAYFPTKRLEALPGKGAGFAELYAGAGLCTRAKRAARLSVLLCAEAEVGSVAGRGYGFDSTPQFRAWTFALGARGALRFRVRPPFAVTLGPWLVVPLRRDHFEVETASGTHELFRLARLGMGFELGVVWEL